MSNVTIPRAQTPLTVGGPPMSPDWYRFLHDITVRVGGVVGVGTNDLLVSQFDDAGIEETKTAVEVMARSLEQAPSHEPAQRISELESLLTEALAQIGELQREVKGIQQGIQS